jgi:hypothetical protein
MAVFASPGAFSAPASKINSLRLGGVRASGAALARNTGTLAAFAGVLRAYTAPFYGVGKLPAAMTREGMQGFKN